MARAGDEETEDGFGNGVTRVGRRLVWESGGGFLSSRRYASAALAKEAFEAEAARYYDGDLPADLPEIEALKGQGMNPFYPDFEYGLRCGQRRTGDESPSFDDPEDSV
jgi:hypothetical protein